MCHARIPILDSLLLCMQRSRPAPQNCYLADEISKIIFGTVGNFKFIQNGTSSMRASRKQYIDLSGLFDGGLNVNEILHQCLLSRLLEENACNRCHHLGAESLRSGVEFHSQSSFGVLV